MLIIQWVGIGLVVIFFLILLIGFIFSNFLLHSHRQPIVRTPREYGMDFEDVQFNSTDGLLIKGWYIPAKVRDDQVVIMTHPFPFNRHGFISKNQGFPPLCFIDVDLLSTAKAVHHAGYGILMFDFRNHGQSQAKVTGIGLNEYQDVLGAVEYIRKRPDLVKPKIGFVSFCMGANATIIALSKAKVQVGDVKFLVAVQPVSANVFVRRYLRAVYSPVSVFLADVVDWLGQRLGGYSLKRMSPLEYTRDITVPTLYVQAPGDCWTTVEDTQSFYETTPGEKEIWWIKGITRRFDAYNYIGEHPERVLEFIKGHF